MRSFVLLVLVLIAACLRCTVAAAEDAPDPRLVPSAPLHARVLSLDADPDRPAQLVVTLYTPAGDGPFPLAVMNHGASGDEQSRRQMPRYQFTMSAYYFLSRGYAVALPMMRGFAGSGGQQGQYGCDFTRWAEQNGLDIAAVIRDLAGDPRIDSSRVIVAGQSFGGWNTLGVGALHVPGVRGLIDFVGGVKSSACDRAGDSSTAMIDGAAELGRRTAIPSLWLYGENDSLFGPNIWRPMHDAYVRHGADAELVDVGRFMEDSHQMLSRPESIPLWAPRVDAFLTRIGMPGHAIYPEYMPMAWPPPTRGADVADVAAVPWINDQGRAAYRTFLAMKPPRVFAISPGGQAATSQGGFDPVATAARMCREHGLTCVPYAIDNDVVFRTPAQEPPPAATRFAALDDVAAVPWINDKGRDNYRAFLRHALPRAFVIGTAGENLSIFDKPDPVGRAMTMCANANIVCLPYAVDSAVVWVAPPPLRAPAATGFATLADVGAVPWVSPNSRALYQHFLTVPLPRAFAVAPGGQAAATQGGYDPLGRALAKCKLAGLTCRPYAVDNDVVWKP